MPLNASDLVDELLQDARLISLLAKDPAGVPAIYQILAPEGEIFPRLAVFEDTREYTRFADDVPIEERVAFRIDLYARENILYPLSTALHEAMRSLSFRRAAQVEDGYIEDIDVYVKSVAAKLVERGVPTPSGKKNWSPSTVESILKNEKYKGEAILQKTITKDFLTKEIKINEGEAPMYHVENSHPAIVSPEIHNLVQEEMTRRKQLGIRHYGGSCFSGKVFCGDCGASYGSKLWHSTSKYRRTIWQCNHKFRGEKRCGTPHLNENDLRKAFVEVINRRLRQKDEIIATYEVIFAQLADCSELDREEQKALREQDEVRAQMKRLIEENAKNAQNQAEYNQQYNGLKAKLDSVHAKIVSVADQRIARQAQQQRLSDFMGELRAREALLNEFDEGLFNATVERITVGSDGEMVFRFKDGTEERYTA